MLIFYSNIVYYIFLRKRTAFYPHGALIDMLTNEEKITYHTLGGIFTGTFLLKLKKLT